MKNLRHFSEVKPGDDVSNESLGGLVNLESFEKGSFIDVTAITKGKGFRV